MYIIKIKEYVKNLSRNNIKDSMLYNDGHYLPELKNKFISF